MTAMAPAKGKELSFNQISQGRRWFLIILASIGSVLIYAPPYLKAVFYTPLRDALHVTDTELGGVFAAYALTALICYLPSGIIADKVRMRTLSSVGFITTAILTGIYATLPSLALLYVVFVAMGITTIFIWWGVRFKLIRLVVTEDEYPKRIGVSYGIYGLAGMIVTFVAAGLAAVFVANLELGVSIYLWLLAIIILVLGILSWLFIPKFEGEIKTGGGFNLNEFVQALKSPVVWIAAISLFFVYYFYTGVTYTTPYMTDVLGATAMVTTVVAGIRNYGITVISGPIFGYVSSRFKPSMTIVVGSLAFVVVMGALMLLPQSEAMVVIAMVLVIVLGLIANGSFAIVSAQLTEGRVPLSYFGAATGLLSIIGFLPDTFSSIQFGAIMEANKVGTNADGGAIAGVAAYQQIFYWLIGAAVLAAVFSFILRVYVRKNQARLEAAEAVEVPPSDFDEATPSDLS